MFFRYQIFLQLHGLEQPLVRNVVWVRHTEETRSLFVLQMQLFYLAPQPALLLLLLSLSRATSLPIILCNNCHFPRFMRASEHHVICLTSVTSLYATCFTFLVDMTTKMVYYIPLIVSTHCRSFYAMIAISPVLWTSSYLSHISDFTRCNLF